MSTGRRSPRRPQVPWAGPPRWWRRRDESGAIIPMVAMLLAVLIPSTAMAVDLGMQRVVRRDLQALADVVALDLVRLVNGRTATQINSGYNGFPTLTQALAESIARNRDVLGDAPEVEATLAFMDPTTHRLQTVVGAGGQQVTREALGSEIPTAIEISASGGLDFAFMPGRGGAHRTAVAVPAPSACFRLGSFAAGLSLSDADLLVALMPSLLNSSTLTATAVGYQGLATAPAISLLDLVEVGSLGVGTPDELLEVDDLTVGQFYAATATALQANGGGLAEVNLLNQLASKANLTSQLAIRDVLDIATGDTAALAASFNVLDLVVGAAYAANGTNPLAVPTLSTQLPGLLNLTSSLTVGEAPKLACGPKGQAKATTGQVALSVSGKLADVTTKLEGPNALTTNLGPLGIALGGLLSSITSGLVTGDLTATTQVSADALVAGATGTLTNIVCGDATTTSNAEGIDVDVAASLVSSVRLASTIGIKGTLGLTVKPPLVPAIPVATIEIDLSNAQTTETTQGTTTTTLSFRHPPDAYGTPKSYGSGIVLNALGNPTVSGTAQVKLTLLSGGAPTTVNVSAVNGLAGALNALLASATSSVNSLVVSPLNTAVVPQLQKQVGVRVGGADLFALPRPSCSDPALAG